MAFLNCGQPIESPVVPFVLGFPAQLNGNGLFHIECSIPLDSTGFNVNFQTGPSVDPRDDVALHLRFAFNTTAAAHLTLNTIRRSKWGPPITLPSCPIRKADPVRVTVLVQPHSFMVACNNQHLCEYPHRINPSAVRYLAVDGGVIAQRILLATTAANQLALPAPVVAPSHPSNPSVNRQVSPEVSNSNGRSPTNSSRSATRLPPRPVQQVSLAASSRSYRPPTNFSRPATLLLPHPVQQRRRSSGLRGFLDVLQAGAAVASVVGSIVADVTPFFNPGFDYYGATTSGSDTIVRNIDNSSQAAILFNDNGTFTDTATYFNDYNSAETDKFNPDYYTAADGDYDGAGEVTEFADTAEPDFDDYNSGETNEFDPDDTAADGDDDSDAESADLTPADTAADFNYVSDVETESGAQYDQLEDDSEKCD